MNYHLYFHWNIEIHKFRNLDETSNRIKIISCIWRRLLEKWRVRDAKGILRLIPYTGGREKTGRRPIVELQSKISGLTTD